MMMRLVIYLKLIRWKNLAMLIYLMSLIKYVLFKTYHISTSLNNLQFLFLICAVVAIASAGYIFNDIKDVETDIINKPQKIIVTKSVNLDTAKKWYFFTNIFGILIGIGLSIHLQHPSYSFLFLIAAYFLYLYSIRLKSLPVLGNIVVSFLIAMVVAILGIMELGTDWFSEKNMEVGWILIMLMLFAFFLNFIREILKDVEDVNGDKRLNMCTLPIILGRTRSLRLTALTCVFPLVILLFIIFNFKENYTTTILFLILFCFLPLLIFAVKLLYLDNFKKIKYYSTAIKIIMFFGMTSLILIQYH